MKKRALAVLLAFSMVLGNNSYLYAAEQEEAVYETPEVDVQDTAEESESKTEEEESTFVEPEVLQEEDTLQEAETERPVIKGVLPAEAEDIKVTPGVKEGQEPDALFSGYVDRAFGKSTPVLRKAAKSIGSRLTGTDAAVYAKVAASLPAIAAGEQASTVFTVSKEELGQVQTSWTAEELGVVSILALDEEGDVIIDENGYASIAADARDEAYSRVSFDLGMIINALLADFPYHLYWYEKTKPTEASLFTLGVDYDMDKEDYVLVLRGSMEFRFPVADEFKAGEYTVNTSVGQSVQASVQNARNIVSKYSSTSDDEKLQGYKDEICALVSYNHEAADGGAEYGNPWQMIWIFDDDPATNVVCEGYAKAFKYLCDESDFSGNISCITVSGTMIGGTGQGPHMWNIVSRDDGYNYLVDVTNCDEGTIGAPDQLFLALNESGGIADGYTFRCRNGQISYVYDEDTLQLYTENELVIGQREDETSAQIVGASVDFTGSIGLNYYIDIPEEYLADSDAYIQYRIDTLTPKTSAVKISEIPTASLNGRTCRKLTVNTVVKSISDKVTLHIYDGEGNKLNLLSAAGSDITEDGFVYSVADYCDDIEKQSSDANMKDLAYKLKQYGLYVQKYLGYKADEANPSMDVSDVTAGMLEQYKGHRTAEIEGLSFYGCSFLFQEDSAVRFRFKLSDGYSIDAYTFTVDGKKVTPALISSQYVIEVGNIRARDLAKEYLIEVADQSGNTQTLSYSGLSYAKALIEQGKTEAAKDAAKALYLYYDAADTYFNAR